MLSSLKLSGASETFPANEPGREKATLKAASAVPNGGSVTRVSRVNSPSSSRTDSSRGLGEQLKIVQTISTDSPVTGAAGGWMILKMAAKPERGKIAGVEFAENFSLVHCHRITGLRYDGIFQLERRIKRGKHQRRRSRAVKK